MTNNQGVQPKAARHKGGRISLTAFEADWLLTVLGTINPIEMDGLLNTRTKPPRRVLQDAGAAWERIVDKVSDIAPEGDGWDSAAREAALYPVDEGRIR